MNTKPDGQHMKESELNKQIRRIVPLTLEPETYIRMIIALARDSGKEPKDTYVQPIVRLIEIERLKFARNEMSALDHSWANKESQIKNMIEYYDAQIQRLQTRENGGEDE